MFPGISGIGSRDKACYTGILPVIGIVFHSREEVYLD